MNHSNTNTAPIANHRRSFRDGTSPQWRYFLYVRKSSEPDDRQVLSLESQKQELLRLYGHLSIVDVIEEAKSAKAPGRPLFDKMVQRIQTGEAQGIIVWHPDRLARNSVDGGRIIYDLDRGKLLDLKFAQYTFENTPEGKWMLNMIFGQSKYFVDKLSKDVSRGLQAKREKGWRPNLAPLGYLNNTAEEKGTKSIRIDDVRFPLVRQMWDLMGTGAYTVPQIVRIANEELGMRTPLRKRTGDRTLATSTLYRIFTNPFYYGWFECNGRLHRGRHQAMITEEQFWKVQKLLGRKGRPRAQTKRHFAFTGLIRCGECGGMITAEEKYKRNKTNDGIRHYIYYRCTKRRRDIKCSQPCTEVKQLEEQISTFIASLTIEDDFLDWALRYLRLRNEQEINDRQSIFKSVQDAYQSTQRQLDELLNLRLRQLISDEEFEAKRQLLTHERDRLKEKLGDTEQRADRWLELTTRTLKFAHMALDRFNKGTVDEKRVILKTLGSNLILCDKKLALEPVKPFSYLQCATQKSNWSHIVNDVRTFCLEALDTLVIPTLPLTVATVTPTESTIKSTRSDATSLVPRPLPPYNKGNEPKYQGGAYV